MNNQLSVSSSDPRKSPRVYHGFYTLWTTGRGDILPRITLKHPLDMQHHSSFAVLNWLNISGTKEDFDRWGYTWNEGVEP